MTGLSFCVKEIPCFVDPATRIFRPLKFHITTGAEMLNRQLVFDTIARHAKLKQRATQPSTPSAYGHGGTPQCRYRTSEGSKCFFGALVPDDRYDPEMEGRAVQMNYTRYLTDEFFVGPRDAIFKYTDMDFVRTLQAVHDGIADPERWNQLLVEAATRYNLSPAVVLEAA